MKKELQGRGYCHIKSAKKNPRNGRKRFRVSYIGINGESLSPSEVEETNLNAKKNICAHLKLFGGTSVLVKDSVYGNTYELDVNGKETYIQPAYKALR